MSSIPQPPTHVNGAAYTPDDVKAIIDHALAGLGQRVAEGVYYMNAFYEDPAVKALLEWCKAGPGAGRRGSRSWAWNMVVSAAQAWQRQQQYAQSPDWQRHVAAAGGEA